MYLGKIVELAPTKELFAAPKHSYTQALLAAAVVPDPEMQRTRTRIVLTDDVPSPLTPPSECRLRMRRPLEHDSGPASHDVDPPLIDVGDEHLVACHLVRPSEAAPQLIDAAELRA